MRAGRDAGAPLMRLSRLALIRYAAYTDRALQFAPEAALHLVYGPNEAGKSSALRAISDLLFGFPHAKEADFLHAAKDLRLGATLTSAAGEAIAFRRRRGNKATLLADSDAESPLNDDALAPWIGGLTREIFGASFGLDSDTLRAGAEEMLKPGGELGSIVMAAASGLVGLTELRTGLEAEADALYAPRASTRAFNAAQARYNAAREAERAGELKPGEWRELNQAIDQAEADLAQTRERRETVLTEEKRIERLRALRGVVAEIDAGAARLATYGDLDAVPEGLSAALDEHRAALADAERRLAEGAAQLDAARRQHERIAVDEALVAHAAEVQAVFRDSGAYAALVEELPAAAAERDAEAGRIADRARRLGRPADAIAARQPTDAALARAAAAVEQLAAVEAAREDTVRALKAAEEALEALDAAGDGAGAANPQDAKANLAALQPRLDALKARGKLAARLATVERAVAEGAAALSPPPRLDAPAIAGLPPVARLAEQAGELRAIERDGLEARKRLREQEERRAAVERRIAEAEAGGPVPSAEAVAHARQARDAAFDTVARAATGEAPLGDAPGAVAKAARLTAEADSLADQALAEVSRVNTYAALKAEAADLAGDITRREADLADLRATLTAQREAWRAPFTAAGLEPGRPDDMVEWRRQLGTLLEDRAEAADLTAEIAALDVAEAAAAAALAAVAESIGLTLPALPTDALAARLAARIGDLEEAWLTGQQTTRLRHHHEEAIARHTARLATLQSERAAAAGRLAAAATDLGLAPGATAAETAPTIALWRELPDLIERRDTAERRHATLLANKSRFEAEVERLVAALAPGLAGLPPAAACAELAERAAAARAASERREAAATAVAAAEEALAERRAERAAVAEAADAAFAGLPQGDRGHLVQRLAARDTAAADLAQCRRRFSEIAPGEEESAIRAALDAMDPATADARRDELAREAARLADEENVAYAALRERQREREALSASVGAEAAAFEKNAASAEMEGVARDWAVLRIASQLLTAAIERQRQRHHAPLIERAGALFATLTNGAYSGLAQRFDESDRMQLYAARGTDILERAALSDGTRDQLFLALRLAIVEDYAGRNEPAPFIGDDIFQTFDDDRTAAGLAALAEIGAGVQPILFAHHRSVVEIARDRLGSRVDVIEL
ncbi:YhaN family protein [Acuticoccus sp. I52.16.1]|uniref:YhaN family protein n=1 Tax=Acuticoccus sp. I52.16.1 TaxID=2928472 RepID=UPI001FD458DD|nr:YhaN family protein [Acuticoccus sp. I52.16.1]UOM33174.1 AAA family ATPase [Acuticoccus sp. I52.16.1]